MKTHKSLILRRLPGAQVIGALREKRRAKKGEGGLVPEPSSALLGAFPRRTSPLFSRAPFNFRAALQLQKTLGGGQVTVAPTYDELQRRFTSQAEFGRRKIARVAGVQRGRRGTQFPSNSPLKVCHAG